MWIESIIRNFSSFFLDIVFRNSEVSIPIDVHKIKKILIYRCDAIGDMIISTALFRLILNRLPDVEIHVLANKKNVQILKYNSDLKKVFIFDGKLSSLYKLKPQIQAEKLDCVFSFIVHKTSRVGTIINLLTGKDAIKIAVRHDKRSYHYSSYFNLQIALERGSCTMAELQARMVCDAFGWQYDKDEIHFNIPLSEKEFTSVEQFCTENNLKDFFVYNISAGRDYNKLSYEKNYDFLKKLTENNHNKKIVLISSPSDSELANKLVSNLNNNLILFPTKFDLLTTCGLIQKSDCVISPDTSIAHLATAYKIPVFVFYSGMLDYINEWKPFGVKYGAVYCKKNESIETINVDDTIRAFNKFRNL